MFKRDGTVCDAAFSHRSGAGRIDLPAQAAPWQATLKTRTDVRRGVDALQHLVCACHNRVLWQEATQLHLGCV